MNPTPAAPVASRPRRRFSQRLGRFFLGLLVVLIVLAVIGAIYQALAAGADRRAHPPVGRMVSVGDYALHLYCTGQGSPTVVLIAGAGNIYAHWDAVQTGASSFVRVCSYDRAGTGWSEYPATQPTLDSHVRDLHALLRASGEPGPYIVVGHSLGGILARRYFNAYPIDVRGMVLVESSIEGMYQHLPEIISSSNRSQGLVWTVCQALAPIGVVRLAGLGAAYANAFPTYSDTAKAAISATFTRTENCRGASWETALTSVFESGAPTPLGNLPVNVLTRGLDQVQASPRQKFTDAQRQTFEQVQKDWLVLQAQLVKLSSNSRQVMADKSGHFIQSNQPELVISAIRDVIARSQPK